LPATPRRQAEIKGAHRTAGPDHESDSFWSDVSFLQSILGCVRHSSAHLSATDFEGA
jgi:hypothetical protein